MKYVEGKDLYIKFEEENDNDPRLTSSEDKLFEWCKGDKPLVLTRMDPGQKTQVVRACQNVGFKVAVTGVFKYIIVRG